MARNSQEGPMFPNSIRNYSIFVTLVASLMIGCGHQTLQGEVSPKNVILMIGDGMGQSVISTTRIWKAGSDGSLFLDQLPQVGLVKTYSLDYTVTDSAAAASAMATGLKTNNGMISVTPETLAREDQKKQLETWVDIAKRQGKSIGVITTTDIHHATPAAFYAHQESRKDMRKIALQIETSVLDLVMGGGLEILLPQKGDLPSDKADLLKDLASKDWRILRNKADLKRRWDLKHPIIGAFSLSHIPYYNEQSAKEKSSIPTLMDMTSYAIQHLSQNPKGFVLIVEGGRIDQAAHDTKTENMLVEMDHFDQSVEVAYKATSPHNTLLMVTADHETGGFTFSGYLKRTEVKKHIMGEVLDEPEFKRTYLSWATGPAGVSEQKNIKTNKKEHPHQAAYYRKKAAHTAVDVPIYSSGIGSSEFSGTLENTDIFFKIKKLLQQ